MSSLSSHDYYCDDMTKMPPLRAMAQTLCLDKRVRLVSAAEAYELARRQHGAESPGPVRPSPGWRRRSPPTSRWKT